VKEDERQKRFPFEIVRKMGDLGLTGGVLPLEYGGLGIDWITHAIIAEEIARASFPLCLATQIVQIGLVEMTILNAGTEEQKQKYLPKLAKGEIIGCFATVEPNVGSDGASIETTAVLDGDCWVLNGTKEWITNGSVSDLSIVSARVGKGKGTAGFTLFLVEKEAPGFSARRFEGVLGLFPVHESELTLNDCRIPKKNILGKVGRGFGLALSSINNARYTIAAGCTGMAQACLDASTKYAKERQQFGRPIASFQLTQSKIAEMALETEAARLLTYKAGYLKSKGLRAIKETSMAKYYATKVALQASIDAIQIHGAYGYADDFPPARCYRDIMGPVIFGGTNDIQRLIIGRDILDIGAFT
jgi:alkylation response protein AidB-like acyl-CoA dehydrogenase